MAIDAVNIEDARPDTMEELLTRLDTAEGGLSSAEAAHRLDRFGRNVLGEERRNPLLRFLSYFWGPIPWMIEAAAILSAVNRDWDTFVIVGVLLLVNGVIGFWEEHAAANALDALKQQLALTARVCRDGTWGQVDASELVPGDRIRLRLGDVIPADVKLAAGEYLSVDQSALTGESLPVSKRAGDVAYSGSIVKQGEMEAVVVATGTGTYFGKTASLVQTAGATSHFQRAVLQIGNFLIVSALVLSGVLLAVELARGLKLVTLISFILIVAVAAIPIAMPAVLSVTMALGALALSKEKAIVARLQSIEELAGIDVLCSDKTGTLTQNRITLGDSTLFAAASETELVRAAALASKAEDADAIDTAVLDRAGPIPEQGVRQLEFTPFDPVSKRTEAKARDGKGGISYVTKGAPQVVIEMSDLSADEKAHAGCVVEELARKGFRALGVARSTDGKAWTFLGVLSLFDPPRPDAEAAITEANEHGIAVKMVTGDNVSIAGETARQLGMGDHIRAAGDFFPDGADAGSLSGAAGQEIAAADGFAEVFPEHKFAIVRALQRQDKLVGMTGDGVNDAPALKQADMGIAVSGATAAARAAADLILTAPGLRVIIRAVEEAHRIFERMMSYTVFRIALTLDVLISVVAAMLIYNAYPLSAIMIVMLALLDDIPIMAIATDNTLIDKKPVRWQMSRVLTLSCVLGALAAASTLGLFVIAREVFDVSEAQARTMMFFQLVTGGHLLIFVTRHRGPFWCRPFPSRLLLGAVLGTEVLALLIVAFGWLMPAISWAAIGLIVLYSVAWMIFSDVVKRCVHRTDTPARDPAAT
jgi:H+-transporting ATPase